MPRRRSAHRAALLETIDRESRRTGSVGAMHAKAIADRAGMHPTDFEALDVLDWTGPISAGELARRVGLTSGAITGVIDRLERDGFVRRTADPGDRRRVIVELNPELQTTIPHGLIELFQSLIDDMADVNDDFTDEELGAVVTWLRRANDAVERSTARFRQPPG